jgi:hypothetical protein
MFSLEAKMGNRGLSDLECWIFVLDDPSGSEETALQKQF